MLNGKERLSRIVADSSQSEVATKVGASQQLVSSWVRGLTRPNDVARHKLQAVFGIPAESWRTPEERKAIRGAQADDAGDTDVPPASDLPARAG